LLEIGLPGAQFRLETKRIIRKPLLEASAQITVTQQTSNITVTSVTTGASNGVQPGQNYQATVDFTSTFSQGGQTYVFWYMQTNSGSMNLIAEQHIYIGANGSASDTQEWTFPSGSQDATVTIMASVDDYISGSSDTPNTPQPFPPSSGLQPNESTYSDNYAQQSVAYQPNQPPPVNGMWASGYVTLPLEEPVQKAKTYSVTPRGVQLPIVNGPNQTWGPPHFYLSY